MARLAYIATLLLVGATLVMLDAPDLVPPVETQIAAASATPGATPSETATAQLAASPPGTSAPPASATTTAPASAAPTAPASAPTAAPPPPLDGRGLAGARIVIARLGIDLPLEWGDVQRDVPRDDYAGATPERVALVFPGSTLPGAGGNTYIYSHARVGMFLTLWAVRLGDVVEIRWPDALLRYEVREIHPRVDPADTSWLDPAGPERVTLQTSTGPYPQDPRFIAVAMPVGTP